MSRRTWQAPSLAVGRRVRSEPAPREEDRHPEPTDAERVRLLALDALEQAAPALVRGAPEMVVRFEDALAARLEGRNPLERRGRKRA